jgi:hypothetical protein
MTTPQYYFIRTLKSSYPDDRITHHINLGRFIVVRINGITVLQSWEVEKDGRIKELYRREEK